jgi:hypothetical protein
MQQSSPHTEGEGSDSVWENPWTLERTAYGWMPLDAVICVWLGTIGHSSVRRAHMQKSDVCRCAPSVHAKSDAR